MSKRVPNATDAKTARELELELSNIPVIAVKPIKSLFLIFVLCLGALFGYRFFRSLQARCTSINKMLVGSCALSLNYLRFFSFYVKKRFVDRYFALIFLRLLKFIFTFVRKEH